MAVYVNQSKFAQLAGITRQGVSKAIRQGRVHRSKKGIDLDHPTNRDYLETAQGQAAGIAISAGPVAGSEQAAALEQEAAGQSPAPSGQGKPRWPMASPPGQDAGEQEQAPGSSPPPGQAVTGDEQEPAGRALPDPLPPAGPKGQRRNGNGKTRQAAPTEIDFRQLDLSRLDKSETGRLYKGQVDVLKAVEQTKGLQLKNDNFRNELIRRDLVKRYFAELYTVETTELLTVGEKLAPEIAAKFGLDDQNAIVEVSTFIQLEISKTLEHIESVMNRFLKSFPAEEY